MRRIPATVFLALLAVFCAVPTASAGDQFPGGLYPVRIDADGTIHRIEPIKLPAPPKTLADWLLSPWLPASAWAAGFDVTITLPSAMALDGTQCTTLGNFSGLAVPRCTQHDSAVFYVPFGMPAVPAAAPSFTAILEIANRDTTSGRHWCYRASCAVVGTAGVLTSSPSGLTYGTATSVVDNTNTGCSSDGAVCLGSATGPFSCHYNDASPATCSGTECNKRVTFFKIEPRATSCAATNVTSADFGSLQLTEAN
jgi:hypothetical protein